MPITVAHVFTNNVPDVIGTVTVFNAASPGSTATVAASDIVKPSNWNSNHAITYSPTGQEIIGAFSNDGNVTFGTNLGGYITASAPSGGGAATVFSNSNNVTFGLNGSTVTASASYPAQTAFFFSNGNGVSFGTAGSTVTASVAAAGGAQTGISGIVAGTQTLTVGTLSFINSNGISFGLNSGASNSQITASYTVPTQTVDTNKAGTGFTSTSTAGVVPAATLNTNGLSFAIPNYLTTAQPVGAYLTTGANSTHSHGNPTLNLTNINGTTASNSAGLTLSLSAVVPAQTVQPVAVSGSNGSFAFSTLSFGASNGLSLYSTNGSIVGSYTVPTVPGVTVFSNSNNVSFGLNGSTVTATATFAQSNQTGNLYVAGNTTQLSSTAGIDHRSLSFEGAGVASVGVSGGKVLISVPAGGGGADGYNIIGVNGGATQLSTTYQFSNANNVSFGLNAGTITASASYAAQTVDTNKAGTGFTSTSTAGVVPTATLNTNGLSFGMPAYITTYVNDLTSGRAGLGFSSTSTAGVVPTATLSTNGLSFAMPNYITTGANSTHSHGNPTLNLTNINGTTASNSAGLTLSLSAVVPAQTVQPVAISGSNGSFAFSTLSMGNLNGLTFYTSNGSMVGSYTVPAGGGVTVLSNSNNVSFGLVGSTYTATATFPAQTNQTGNLYVTANSTQLSSTAGIDLRSVSFAGAGIASVGVSGGVVVVSVPSGGGAGDGVNIIQAGTTGTTGTTYSASTGTMFINGGNNITVSQNGSNQLVISAAQGGIAAGTQTATSGTLVFANSNGVTFGMSGSSQITASVNAGGGGGFTKTFWYPYNEAVNVMGQQGQATFVINPLPLDDELNADRIVFPVYFSNASNSTGSLTVSYWVGIYSKNGSTLSSAASTSFTATLGYAGNNSSGQQRGIRLLTAPWTTTLQQSRYYVGIGVRSTTAGANATLSQVLVSQLNSNVSGLWDVASTRSIQWPIGVGYFSASTTGVPSTIALSHIDGSNSLAARPPSWHMISGTV